MAKRIVLAVFGGIAVLGLLIAVAGFALGGRTGIISTDNGQMVYYDGSKAVPFASAPYWLSNLGSRRHQNRATAGDVSRAPLQNTPETAAPFAAGQLTSLQVDISAGYVNIVAGDNYGLTVDGPMEYSSTYNNGEWVIEAYLSDIDTRTGNGFNHFWWNGNDITTTFTITVPAAFTEMDVRIGMGEANIRGFALDELECSTEMGSVVVSGTAAKTASFDVNMGNITVTGFSGLDCELDCDMGNISFDGDVSSHLDINCDLGHVEARLPRPANYGWSAEVGLGSIRIDGSKITAGISTSSHGGDEHATPFFELECGLGDIEVSFK